MPSLGVGVVTATWPLACSDVLSPSALRACRFKWTESLLPPGLWPPMVASLVCCLGFRITGFFPPLGSSWFLISQAGSERAHLVLSPGPEARGRLRGPPRWQGGLEVRKLPEASQPALGAGISEIPMGPGLSVSGSPQDHLGEGVKEPERTQEHCLPNFAGGQHFFEYLLVVSLKKKHSGPDYEPTITYQFPKVRTGGRSSGGWRSWEFERQWGEGPSLTLPLPHPPWEDLSRELP